MIHPNTELRFINEEIGNGVFATRFMPKGTIVWTLDKLDREFTPHEIEEIGEPYLDLLDKYTYRNSDGNHILCWDNGKYINHSFYANCMSTAYNFEVAIRDIQEGEELTDDYGFLNITEPFRASDEGSRRKNVYPDDLTRYHRVWDKKLFSAFRRVPRVDQPLRKFIDDDIWETCLKISSRQAEMASILNLYYAPSIQDYEISGRPVRQSSTEFQGHY